MCYTSVNVSSRSYHYDGPGYDRVLSNDLQVGMSILCYVYNSETGHSHQILTIEEIVDHVEYYTLSFGELNTLVEPGVYITTEKFGE